MLGSVKDWLYWNLYEVIITLVFLIVVSVFSGCTNTEAKEELTTKNQLLEVTKTNKES